MTVVSIYVPPSVQQCQTEIDHLLDQLPGPLLLLGDFNAHHPVWGSTTSNTLGQYIAETMLDKQLILLNDGSYTRIDPATGSTSALDLTFCSETLASRFLWRTLPDTYNSDHLPIIVASPCSTQVVTKRKKWLYDQADWAAYEQTTAESIKPGDEIDLQEFVDRILSAATATIPRSTGRSGPKAVPWWCPEAKAAIKLRRKTLRTLKRTKNAGLDVSEALRKFQEARAASRKAIQEAKRRSWAEFVDTISPKSTASEMWRSVNTLRGKRNYHTAVIKRADGFTDKPEEVAEELAVHYSDRSATNSYTPSFQKTKEKAERKHSGPSVNNNAAYNSDFTLNELLWALDRGRSVSTGPDSVGYPMLRRLPLSVKTALLGLLNRIWHSGVYPCSWRTGIIVPIPKPNCSDSGPAAFRPITLTNCIAKVFERIVNRRLTTELEANGRLDKRQHAFRAGFGTDTYLAELEKMLPNTDEHCLMASLDLSKAYDTTWRYGILRTLRKWRISGRMLGILESFLTNRTFQVSIGGILSREMTLENGVPQGSVLSVTLFLVAMQPIFQRVPHSATVLLYADDILLAVKRDKHRPLLRVLQSAVKAVNKWTASVGFKISPSKSSIFYCSPNARREPSGNILIDRVAVPKTGRLKIIGITLDRTLNFKQHCKTTKAACNSRLRIMKMIAARNPRGHRNTLMRVGSAVITSRLLYGIGIVSRTTVPTVQTLAPAYNTMIRYASGAYVTSPIPAVMAEAGVLPFDLLVHQTLIRTAIRMLEKNHENIHLPVVQRASNSFAELTGTPFPKICVRSRLTSRPWYVPKPRIVWDIKRRVKAGDPPERVRPVVQEMLTNRFHRTVKIYTDGSKSGNTVGAGVFSEALQQAIGLPPQCSVFSAEAFAIKSALANFSTSNELFILSDSASCLMAIESGNSQHPWIQEIESLLRNRPIQLCWIPGHAGVHGNEKADRLADEGRNNEPIQVGVPGLDAVKAVKEAVRRQWNMRWAQTTDVKLREVKYDTLRWPDHESSTDQRILTRLRIGHTRLTHGFLLEKTSPPICDCCGIVVDVRHIILHCRKFYEERRKFNIDPTNLHAALRNDSDNEKRVLEFLHETNLYRKL